MARSGPTNARRGLTPGSITPNETTRQFDPASESLEQLSRIQHRATGGIVATLLSLHLR